MTAIADLLFATAAAALFVAGAVWVAKRPGFGVSEVVFTHELKEVRQADVELALGPLLRGNFFSVNIDAVRHSLEQIAWVRHAEVRRRWPAQLEVEVEEHEAAALWGINTDQLLNTHGEVFSAITGIPANLPVLHGPPGTASEILDYYHEAQGMLEPLGRQPQSLTLSPRLAVQLKLDDGMVIELGRDQPKLPVRLRLQRFVDYYPTITGNVKNVAGQRQQGRPSVVDMRYPNGFALRSTAAVRGAATGVESKGKQ